MGARRTKRSVGPRTVRKDFLEEAVFELTPEKTGKLKRSKGGHLRLGHVGWDESPREPQERQR